MKKKSLVLGGSGFIGQALCRALKAAGETPVILDIISPPNRNFPFVKVRWGKEKKFLSKSLAGASTLYYLAWSTKPASANSDPLQDFLDNVEPALKFLEEYRREKYVFRVVFVSSGGAVYGESSDHPVKETHFTDPINAYGIGKLTVEYYLKLYHRLNALDYVILRPSNAYGQGQNPFGEMGAVNVFLGKVLKRKSIEIWGDGSIVRDYLHIDDLTSAAVAAGNYRCRLGGPRTFNVASGEAVSLRRLIQLIVQATGQKIAVDYLPARGVDVHRIKIDLSQANKYLKWKPRVSLERGIDRTWQWIREVYGTGNSSSL